MDIFFLGYRKSYIRVVIGEYIVYNSFFRKLIKGYILFSKELIGKIYNNNCKLMSL